MKTQHTPGTWKYQDHRIADDLMPGNGWRYGLTIRDKRNICVAAVGHVDYATVNEAEANARLIAAAPIMLEALKTTHEVINSYNHIPAIARVCCKLQAAISAAEGVKP